MVSVDDNGRESKGGDGAKIAIKLPIKSLMDLKEGRRREEEEEEERAINCQILWAGAGGTIPRWEDHST